MFVFFGIRLVSIFLKLLDVYKFICFDRKFKVGLRFFRKVEENNNVDLNKKLVYFSFEEGEGGKVKIFFCKLGRIKGD